MYSQITTDESSQKIVNNEVCDTGYYSTGTMKSCDVAACSAPLETYLKDLSLKDSSSNNLIRSNEKQPQQQQQQQQQEQWVSSPEWYYTQNDEGDTPLHVMIITGKSDHAFWLIGIAPSVNHLNIVNDTSQTALHLAAMSEQAQVARQLVLMGAKLTCQTYEGNTPLHLACIVQDIQAVRAITSPLTTTEKQWILSQGRVAPVTQQFLEVVNYEGYTSLHLAVMKNNIQIVAELLSAGANASTRDHLSGRTALHLAVENNYYDIAYLIAQQRPDCLNQLTYGQVSAYQMALEINPIMAQDLLRLGASPELRYSSDSEISSDESSSDESSFDDECDNYASILVNYKQEPDLHWFVTM